jgi:hypothetical protein
MVDARSRIDAGATSRDRLGLGGTIGLTTADGMWHIEADVSAGGVPLSANVGGRLNTASVAASTLGGTLSVVERQASPGSWTRSCRQV